MMQEHIHIRTQDGEYWIIGGDFQSMLQVVRSIPGRRFRSDEKLWELPCRVEEVQKAAESAGFHVTASETVGRPLSRPSHSHRDRPNRLLIRTSDGDRAVVGGDFDAMLATIKALEGRKWLRQERIWQVPGSLAEIEKALAAEGFQLVPLEEAELPSPLPPEEPSTRRGDQIHIRTEDGEYWVVGGAFRDMLDAIKGIEGRRFISEEKLWQLPCTSAEARRILAAAGYKLEPFATPPSNPLEPSNS